MLRCLSGYSIGRTNHVQVVSDQGSICDDEEQVKVLKHRDLRNIAGRDSAHPPTRVIVWGNENTGISTDSTHELAGRLLEDGRAVD